MTNQINPQKTGAAGADALSPSEGKGKPEKKPDTSLLGKFDQAMQGKGEKNQGGKGESGEQPGGMMSDLSAIFQKAQASVSGMGTTAASAAAQAAAPNPAEKLDGLVDRILVSTPKPGEAQEIRITLNNDLLPGTEVRMSRADGELKVEFVVDKADSGRFLQTSRDDLSNRLANKLSDSVEVKLTYKEDHSGGESQDGRSRQQRNLYDEMEKND
jgi:type III secretion system needle length determinant